MQLTKLEINGFKSFGDRVTINFDEGITGIVGPNGCGKSNVVDAIRWVLGEQKIKTLRSDKMENVIFNGTKKRKPTQLAEVSLSFSNTKNILPTEYSEVTVTRKYFRSGDSEYMLNGVTCRLKDITNLFLDTGIGSDSYAIIELKMVDDLLNDKDNSRRTLFEEAAGIAKFKKRKKETLRKIDDTDADLERVEDLLFEIDKNLKSLEKQAKQAEKYYQLKEDYREQSVALARTTVSKQNEAYQNLTKHIQEENDKKVELNKKVAEKEAEIEKQKANQITKEKDLAAKQKALNEHVNNIRHYESDKQIKNERLKFLNDKSETLREQIEQDRKSKERAGFSIDSLKRERKEAETKLAELKSKVLELQNDFEDQKSKTSHLQEEVNAVAQLHRNKQDEVFHHKKEIEIKEIQLTALKQELEKTASDTSEKSASLLEFEKKIGELESDLNAKSKQLDKLKQEEENLQARIESTEKTIEVIREEQTQLNRQLDAKQNEYNLTKSMIDNLEGFPEAIKFLRKESGWGKKAPLLSDIVTCSDEYRVTIENYLEPVMNYYVVPTEAEAYKAINLLSDAAKGKANFFILDTFENFKPTPAKIYSNAFLASEIVEYDKKYQKLISYILDNVYVTTGDQATIPKGDDSIFITQNGKITKRKYSLSGGSVGLFEGKKLGRAKNLEKLDKDIKKLQKKLAEVEQSRSEKEKELDTLVASTKKTQIEEQQESINLINEEFISIRTKHEQFRELLTSTDTKKEDMLANMDQLQKDLDKLRPNSLKEQKEFAELEKKLGLLNEDLSTYNELLDQKSAAFNEENIFFHQQENRVASVEQELSYKEAAFESSTERIEKNQEELKSNEQEIKELIEKSESNDDYLIALYKEKEEKEQEVGNAEKDYYQVRGDIDELEKSEREIQRERENIDSLLMELQNKLNDTKLELSSVKERLSVEFNLDIEDILKENIEVDNKVDEHKLREKVEKLRDRMENMGPINPMAMEAYEEIQERHVFISSQKEDLLKAKESLLATIDEIDLVAKATFLEAFEKIKDNFIRVFRTLFTEEDDCDLRLVDHENPLESAIEIIAKPKGKKPLTINQLSGGEKTLTATSLLFAIYLLKPAPFCIFDEVDAPLDDANIDKFNRIIRDFSKESQFIIVTHNKRTMEQTDVIYGVTMIEQGVSKVIPADLRKLA